LLPLLLCVHMQGLRKPAPGAYQAAVSHLQLPPEQLIFVDDRQANVDAAAAAGLQSIKFSGSAEALEAELRQLGLDF
jgi:HAD superfamily hydrolase (TIGR01509 family)